MKFDKLPDNVIARALSETAKYRHLTYKYCIKDDGMPGCGVDIASQGDPVVPWAISFDLPLAEFREYNCGQPPKGHIHLRGTATSLPFEKNSLDFVYSSHLLEDFADWTPVVSEWVRVLAVGGKLIILIPDREGWAKAMGMGQPDNVHHKHEGTLGEMSSLAESLGLAVIEERMTRQFDGDYTIMGVFKKVAPTPYEKI